jgi:DNA polymerase-1
VHRINKDALFVIDGSYLLYRSFYAIKPLYNASGIPTQAVYGFCRAIKKIIADFAPQYLVVAWDSKVKSFRYETFPAYKATRQKPPSELFIQKEYIISFLDAVKIAQITCDGYEGDDVIASVTKHFPDSQIVLVCPDKDMYQLLSPRVLIFDPFKNRLIDEETFAKENGFTAAKIPFYYALLGDSSDNIPGVSGIGKKGAQDLVVQFASLDDLYNNLEKITKERTRTLLAEQKENAYLSYKLFLLAHPPLSVTPHETAYSPSAWANAAAIFQELGFTSLLREIQQQQLMPVKKQVEKEHHTQSLFEQSSPEASTLPQPIRTWDLVVIQTKEALEQMIAELTDAPWFALDTETTGSNPMLDTLVGMSFACTPNKAFYLPIGHLSGLQLDRHLVISQLKPLLENPSVTIVLHNAKFDQQVLYRAGISIAPIAFDTLIAASLLRAHDKDRINLKALSEVLLHEPMDKFKDVLGKTRTTFAEVPVDEAAAYGAHDALQTYKIKSLLADKLAARPSLFKLFNDVEMPFYSVLMEMERAGILLDPVKIAATANTVADAIKETEKTILAALPASQASATINLNSPRQVEALLFDVLELPAGKKSAKGSRSTDQEVLEEIQHLHSVPKLLLQYRELMKLRTTYLEPLPTFINPETHRIHTSYSQTMVATGRLASSDPNLQNIPASEGFGRDIREAFYAAPGCVFLAADYSQIELRILAHLSQDATLTSIFLADQDIHTQTAAQLFDVSVDNVSHEQRQLGKRINFSIMYGITPYGLAKDLGIKQSEAKTYIEKYFSRFPGVATWITNTIDTAMQNGFVETLFGRRRYIPELAERNKTMLENGKRMAINTPVQGTQAEIMKLAMIRISALFAKHSLAARMILQIHDELILEVPEHELATVEEIIQHEMGHVVDWEIPLKITTRSGKTWANVTK